MRKALALTLALLLLLTACAVEEEIYDPEPAVTVSPLAAYVLARENEIKCVRVILSGKRNGLSEQSIREKVRETYV